MDETMKVIVGKAASSLGYQHLKEKQIEQHAVYCHIAHLGKSIIYELLLF